MMRYISFRIRNFRGIKDTTISLNPVGAGIFTLIGLNESGKTTLLEAMQWFEYNQGDEKSLYKTDTKRTDASLFVPKGEKATFTGEITVSTIVQLEESEVEELALRVERECSCKIDRNSIERTFSITRGQSFIDGDKDERIHRWGLSLRGRLKGAKKERDFGAKDAPWDKMTDLIAGRLPEIVYFPTFLFEQPSKIVLNPQAAEGPVDRVYRQIIESVGKALPRPIDTASMIVNRIVIPETAGETFVGIFSLSQTRQQQIDAAINQISHHLSVTVLGSWSRIFGGDTANREIRLKLGVDKHDNGAPRVYVQFSIRDGIQQYDVSERSLGFRWFFSFLLFTLFRPKREGSESTLFLLDEPASNLHAGAQAQLLESLPRIAKDGNRIVFSTHSHYLINPEWLDQAYIVSNDALADDLSTSIAYDGVKETRIDAQRYRNFVGKNPDKTSYFQPVLDKLQVIPSKLDLLQPAVLVEGKGDYLILTYGLWNAGLCNGKYTVLPTRGANHFSELVGIMLGWGVRFCACFDDDKPGRAAVRELINDWGISEARAFTLSKVHKDLIDGTVESFLEESDRSLIAEYYEVEEIPSKSQIQLFFSEALAGKRSVALSAEFTSRIKSFHNLISTSLNVV